MKTKEKKAWARITSESRGEWTEAWIEPGCQISFVVSDVFEYFIKKYCKIPKISPGLYIFQSPFLRGLFLDGAYIRRGLPTEGNLRLKIDWASLIVGGKFTVFALFYFIFEGNFPSTSPRGACIWRGDLTEGFLPYQFGGLIFGILL